MSAGGGGNPPRPGGSPSDGGRRPDHDPRPDGSDAVLTGRQRRRALVVGLVATFMTLLDVSIVNVAIPSIERAVHADPSHLQWILSGYALTFGLMLVPAGRLGDTRGRRDVFTVGLALFTVTSAVAGLAGSTAWLIGARLLQGAAAGVVNPQVTGLIQQLYRGADRGRPFGMLGATIGVSTAIGPLLGGALIELGGAQHGWRWVFLVNVPVGIGAIAAGWRLLPAAPARPARRRSVDPVGVLLLGLAITLLLLPLVQARQWRGPLTWLLTPAGLLVLLGFVGWELRYRRLREPLFDLALFRLRSYTLGALIALFYFVGFVAIFFLYTVYLQNGLRYGALEAGLAVTPFAVGSAVTAVIGGRVVNRFGRPLVVFGLATVALGLAGVVLALLVVPGRGAPLTAATPLLLAGLGSGLVITPNQTLTLAEVPVDQAGSAAGMLQTSQRIGAAAGIAGIGAIFFGALAAHRGWTPALREALLAVVGFVLVALVAAVVDSRGERPGARERAADG